MTDDDLEQRLHAHYRAIDPTLAPPTLGIRIRDALERRPNRPAFIARTRPAFAAAIAAVVIVAVGLGLRPGGFLSSPGASPTTTPSTQPSAVSPEPSSSPVPPTAAAAVDLAGTFSGGGLWALQGSTLLVSIDAGASWRRSAAPMTATVAGVWPAAFVLDPERAWAVTPGPGTTEFTGSSTDVLHVVVHRTSDGGQTWQDSTVSGNYAGTTQSLVFLDPQYGYLLCSPQRLSDGVSTVLRTDDGGATWSVAGTADSLGSIDWLGSMFSASDASTLWAGAEQEAGPVAHPILDVSRDGGRTWQDARLPGLEGQSGGAMLWLAGPPVFLDATSGLVTVVSADTNGLETRIYRTTDAGRSWVLVADRPVEASAGPAMLDAAHWLLPVGPPFGLLATADGGASWRELTMGDLSNGGWMVWIGAVDAGHAAALVTPGDSPGRPALYLSADGGTTWQPADLGGSTAPVPSPSASTNPSPSPTTIAPFPSGSVPPISSVPWTGLRLQRLEGGPVNASSVVAWSGGYLALGQPTGVSPPTTWISRDGRSWVQLPADTFPAASSALAAPCADGVLVAIESGTGDSTVWYSADGVTWASNPWPLRDLAREDNLAGDALGAVGILDETPPRLAFSAGGVTWQTVSLPGGSAFRVRGVAASGNGFVALGDAGTDASGTTSGSPVAWWSADGVHWTLAAIQAHPGDGFYRAQAGRSGLVAFSTTVGAVPGLASFWTSPDGQGWKVSTADPLGVWQDGEGQGSANGLFVGDGTRLLGYGIRASHQPTEYWDSLDGTDWTKLALVGDTAAAVSGQVGAFLLRDGVLFISDDAGSSFGTATK